MGYTKVFSKPYPAWHDVPTKDTPVTADVMEEYDEAILSIENHLDGSTAVKPVSKDGLMTQSVGVDSNGRLWTEPGGGGGSGNYLAKYGDDSALGAEIAKGPLRISQSYSGKPASLTVGYRVSQTIGENSTSLGYGNLASGACSVAEGNNCGATANLAHAEGSGTLASGIASHAEGGYTQATESYAHAEGNATRATGALSHAQGSNTLASGTASSASGTQTVAGYENQTVVGVANDNQANTLFEVGNGAYNSSTEEYDRSNAFTVDSDGNIEFPGEITAAAISTLSDSDYIYISVSGVIKKISLANLKTVLGIS